MDSINFILEEFIARKEQMLNLEMRNFILFIIFEILFFIFYIFLREKLLKQRILSVLSLSIFSVFQFHILAILGKMGLISIYMKQFESFLSSLGHKGLIWESKAIEKIIFPIGNAFTFPTIIMIFLIIAQTIYAYWFTLSLYLVNKKLKFIIVLILSFFIIFVFLKSLTIDFYTEIPNIF